MRAKCCVYGCKSATYNKQGFALSFHRFPQDPGRQAKWNRFCKNDKIGNKNFKILWVCSLHFEKSLYSAENKLSRHATPTLNPPKGYDKTLYPDEDEDIPEAQANQNTVKTEAELETNYTLTLSEIGSLVKAEEGDDCEPKAGPSGQTNYSVTLSETGDLVEDDDCESVTFSSEEDGSDDDAMLKYIDDDSIPDIIPSTSKAPVSLTDSTKHTKTREVSKINEASSSLVEPVYTVLPDLSIPDRTRIQRVKTVLPKVNDVRTVADNVENIDLEEEDDCSTFAAHVKSRMRNFNQEQKIIAQKLISDIMFMADTRQLHISSAVVNPAPPAQPLANPQPVSNGAPVKKEKPSGTFFAYTNDSSLEDDDEPLTKKKK